MRCVVGFLACLYIRIVSCLAFCWGGRPPVPGAVGEFFLGGFQDGEDRIEGFGAGELGAELTIG